jgi:hypothetical protein
MSSLSLSLCVCFADEKDDFIAKQCARLSDGIQKINEASQQIDQLSLIVEEQRKNVVAAAEKCETMLVGIESCEYMLWPAFDFHAWFYSLLKIPSGDLIYTLS